MTDHPLIVWYAGLMKMDAAKFEGSDIVLADLGGKRFAIGVEPDGTPLLCCLDRDKEALTSVSWTSAVMVFGHKDRDWIALSCKDMRVRGSSEMNSVPVRLWVPLTLGRLDPWKDHAPDKMTIATMKAGKKGAVTVSGSAFANVPMKMIG
jgi:hypothetical protein